MGSRIKKLGESGDQCSPRSILHPDKSCCVRISRTRRRPTSQELRSMIKAVLFDMDGVLIDAKEWHYESLNRALDLFGMAIDRDAHLATFDGLPTRRKLEI